MVTPIRVSVASMWQRFHGCTPDFIRDVCHGKCCDAPTRPSGTLITIHRTERAAIEARGGVVVDGVLASPDRVCPFKTDAHLCGLHDTGDKPFGCIVSPFMLNAKDCLVVRNRYRFLPCYASAPRQPLDGKRWPPAFVAFRASLDRLFGHDAAELLVEDLEMWGDPKRCGADGMPRFLDATLEPEVYAMLGDRAHTLDRAK